MPSKKQRFRTLTNADRALHLAIAAHYTAMGASKWPWEQFARLCETLRCKPKTLAVVCGLHPTCGIQDWHRGVPSMASLTLAVIKQFVDFKITGVLSRPIIPLDTILTPARINHIRKYRRREKRRSVKQQMRRNSEKRMSALHYGAKI